MLGGCRGAGVAGGVDLLAAADWVATIVSASYAATRLGFVGAFTVGWRPRLFRLRRSATGDIAAVCD